MTINCAGAPPPVNNPKTNTQPVEWTPGQRTQLEDLVAQRKLAMEAQASMYRSVDPIVAKQQRQAAASQEYWEAMVFDAGKRATLDPNKSRNVEIWLANWLGLKSFTSKNGMVREPLLNIKRQADGMLREAGVYLIHNKARELQSTFKDLAKARGVETKLDDVRRLLEEGMTPQRLAVFGNTPMQEAHLLTRFNLWQRSMLDRGFLPSDIQMLLDQAQTVSKQWDELQAVSMATGMNVGDLHNIGYFPRQFTDDGFTAAKLAGAVNVKDFDLNTLEGLNAAMSKSRSTWQYLAEDHAIAAKLMGISNSELHSLIADPVEFAQFLSKKFANNPEDLDLLVDSGIMSKIPMLTSHVEEYLSKVYQIPGVPSGMFIADPLAATEHLVKKLQAGAERSALSKYIGTEGIKNGWAVPNELYQIDPSQFPRWVTLSTIPGYQNVKGAATTMVHPDVAAQAGAILNLSKNPGQLAGFEAAYNAFTNWFAKQALGNPITAKAYLYNQFAGNMLGAMARGANPHNYFASFVDVVRVASFGLETLDNVKPFRIIDGKPITHRQLVARTLRMFSRDVLPGLDVGVVDFSKLDPRYTLRQLQNIGATATTTAGYAKEVAKLLNGKADSIFLPTLKVAQMMDLAGQLAIVRSLAPLDAGDLAKSLDTAGQFLTTGTTHKLDKWDDLVIEVKRGMPQFDDLGKIPGAVSKVIPFSAWMLANAPLQFKSMLREPSRWHNYIRAHSMWNQSQLEANERAGGTNPNVGEMQQWERDAYGMISFIDPRTRQVHMHFSANYDPRWGTVAGLFAATRDRSQDPETIRKEVVSSNAARTMQRFIGNTYFGGLYEVISGTNPLTGLKRDDSSFTSTQFANIPMPPLMASILSISPVLQSVDRLEAISGTKAILDSRTGAVVQQATNGWLGNQGKLKPNNLVGLEQTVQFLGGKVRVIDGIANMQFNENETKSTITKLTGKAFAEQKQLAIDLKQGSVQKDSPEYKRRVETIHKLYDTALQVNMDLKRIEAWAIVHKVPSRDMLKKKQDLGLAMDAMPLPGADYVEQILEQSQQFKRNTP